MVCADARPSEQWIYHWNAILLPDLLIFLNRFTCHINAKLLKDILIHIRQQDRRMDLTAAELRERL